jgi:HK97 family phage major capsid protein
VTASPSLARAQLGAPFRVDRDVLELAELLKPAWPAINRRIDESGHPTARTTDPDAALKDKLKTVESQLAAERDARVEAQRELDAARQAFANSGTPLSQDTPEFKAAAAARAKVGAIDDRIAELTAMQVETLKLLGQDAPEGGSRFGDGAPPFAGSGGWSAGDVLRDGAMQHQLEQMASTTFPVGRVQLGEVAGRDALVQAFAADVTGTPSMRRADYAGIVPQLRRRLRILDLIPMGTMDNNSLPYTQESGSFAGAAETVEGAAKPEGAVTFTDQTADAKTIAFWLKNRKQVLADAPAVQSIIEGRLRYGVERRFADQILSGDGVGENIRGILSTSGIGAVAFTAGALVADQILKGITTVFLADAEANAVVLHPTDWQTALIAKSTYTAQAGVTGGSGEYFSGGPFAVTPQQIWGIPLIPSAAIAQGTALVADFTLGAQAFIREGVNVLISDSDQDDFIKNRVTILAEMRAALAVFRPAAFCVAALA